MISNKLAIGKFTAQHHGDLMKQCVELIGDKALIEASGNVTIDTIGNIAKTGVDVISSSAIVAKAKTLDIALDM